MSMIRRTSILSCLTSLSRCQQSQNTISILGKLLLRVCKFSVKQSLVGKKKTCNTMTLKIKLRNIIYIAISTMKQKLHSQNYSMLNQLGYPKCQASYTTVYNSKFLSTTSKQLRIENIMRKSLLLLLLPRN
jgi:hypothetical protein